MCRFVESRASRVAGEGTRVTLSEEETFRRSLVDEFANDADVVLQESETLRHKAYEKFGELADGATWWVTRRSLQQSTAWQVARLKASWFADASVADLCCGIGGDAMWLAQRGPLVAVDCDRLVVRLATANCERFATLHDVAAKPECLATDAIAFTRDWRGAVHIDPDRRSEAIRHSRARRTTAPDFYAPAWTDVANIIHQAPSALVKLAPTAELDPTTIARPSHRTWISLRGSVREQTLLVGDALVQSQLTAGTRSAIALQGDGTSCRFSVESADEIPCRAAIASEPGAWMIDPDAAIRAAGLTDAFANAHQLQVIGAPSGFLTTANEPAVNAGWPEMAVAAPVQWCGSSDERKLKKAMRQHGVYAADVKVRGVDRDPVTVIRTLRDCGDRPVTLWLGAIGKKVYAAWTAPHQPQRANLGS